MSAYTPSEALVAAILIAALVVLLLTGYLIGRYLATGIARTFAWIILVLGTLGIDTLAAAEPPGVRMIALITFALLAMKIIVVVEERARGMTPLSFGMWLGFATTWLGMRPGLFTSAENHSLRGTGELIRRGSIHTATGFALVLLARVAWTSTQSRLLATLLLLPALSLMLHFGLCNLLAGLWRTHGVACEALFRAPLKSESLGEFWARRWNLAFSEMTTIAVYRPLIDVVGRGPALMAGFALSGLLHEMAISVPVRAGWGLPLLYFLLHGALVLIERALSGAGYQLTGWVGRAWVFFWVIAPLPILFHRAFLSGIVWPIIGISR